MSTSENTKLSHLHIITNSGDSNEEEDEEGQDSLHLRHKFNHIPHVLVFDSEHFQLKVPKRENANSLINSSSFFGYSDVIFGYDKE